MELEEIRPEVNAVSSEERAEEQKLIRRLQMMMNMVMQVIAQDATLTVDDASQMIADSTKGRARHVPRQGTGVRPDLAAALPATDARALSHDVMTCQQQSIKSSTAGKPRIVRTP